jgi:hypothetical protein
LSKALGIKQFKEESHEHAETTPYNSLKELTDDTVNEVQRKLFRFYTEIREQWISRSIKKAKDGRILKLNGKIYLNPKTGKPLTISEWNAIKKDIDNLTSWIFGNYDESLVKRALALGRILQGFDTIEERIDSSIEDLDIPRVINSITHDELYRDIINYGMIHTGELITDLTNRARKKIVQVIMDSYNNKSTSRELTQDLFDAFSTLNRDWRRIAETELAYNFNSGYMLAELEQLPEGQDYVFMEGIAGGGACPFCANNVDRKEFVLLKSAPKGGGDVVEIDGDEYTAIWPGKTNENRSRSMWRVCVINHPNCLCTYIKIDYRSDDFSKRLREVVEQ